MQVKAFVELAGSLLSAGGSRGQPGQPAGLSGEMLRFMRFAGVVNALINALKLVDMDHPEVKTPAHPSHDEKYTLNWSAYLVTCTDGRKPFR
jgi:hypothetical protein